MKAVEFYRTFRSYIDYIFNKSESFLIPAYVNFLSLHTVYCDPNVSKDARYFAL